MSEAKNILEGIIQDFSSDKFIGFFREKSRQFVVSEESHIQYNDADFKSFLKLGEINFNDGESIVIFASEVLKELSEKTGKKLQYEKSKNILKSSEHRKFSAGIFIFYDKNNNFRFSLVYPEAIGKKRQWNNFRRFTYFVSSDPRITNKTFLKQIGDKDFAKLEDVKEAFSITAVTDIFYKDFFDIYHKIVTETKKENKIEDEERARDFVLLFAIRTVFLGFIQKKGWIGNDEKFIQGFFVEYKNKSFGKNEFYLRWLTPLFFEALNSAPGRKVAYGNNDFSKETETSLQLAPYLNGGLFKEKKNFDNQGWLISDENIDNFFEFLFCHSFTIEENSMEDEDLQLNPEFLGIIFERLVNKANGAVYTPRTEVDLMCRLSLVKWLQKNLSSSVSNQNLYELFFKESEKEEDQKQGSFSKKEAEEVLEKLESLAICDPAVGSGAFLVGMMQVLDDVEQSLKQRYGLNGHSLFERKKQIIKGSLYGVEVKEWAVWICQLRLWLSLFVDAPDDLKNSLEPILPSLDFKVRQGDSLVQRVGSKAFPVSGHNLSLTKSVKDKITKLKNLKLEYFDNKSPLKEWELRQKELGIYEEILDIEIKEKEVNIQNLKNDGHPQTISFFEEKQELNKVDDKKVKSKITELEEEIAELAEQKDSLRKGGKPLVWSIEFADVFAEKGGFDLVIGNPAYIRQEDIVDPNGKIKDKKEYKSYLQEMVKLDFPNDFPPKVKINAQSDLYTYFYIRSLRLLNPGGMHTFICSNSWLDVGYGAWLQEFLLKRCPVEFIIDNSSKRSFASADVNTIISIIHAPQKKIDENHLVKFVAFKKPFEEVVYTENLMAIENSQKVESNDIFRVYPILTHDLLEAGLEYADEEQKILGGKYIGNKWGGKYLRAPDIFFAILGKGQGKLVKLSEISKNIKRNNLENFSEWQISKDKFRDQVTQFPFLHSLKDTEGICVNYNNLKSFNKTPLNIDTEYIKPDIISNRFVGERMFFIEGGDFLVNDSFFIAQLKDQYDKKNVLMLLNSTLSLFLLEIIGRKTFAVGVMYVYGPEFNNMLLLNPQVIKKVSLNSIYTKIVSRKIYTIFKECGIDPKSEVPIEDQEPKPLPDRKELDDIVFDALGLSTDERREVYRAVCRLVSNRISKAKSV